MNRRIAFLFAALALAALPILSGSNSQASQQAKRRAINLPGRPIQAPFSDAVLAGDTLYLAGRIGIEPKTGKPPAEIEQEARLMLDGFKTVLAESGMTMDDIVSVQVYCTDLLLFDKFNGVYRGYFSKDFPARAFIGAGSLLLGGHFEMQAIAVRR